MITAVQKSPKWIKAYNRYEKAYHRYLKVLYEDQLSWQGYGHFAAWVEVTQLLPSTKFGHEWGETKWVTGQEYEDHYENNNGWVQGRVISKLEIARFMFNGWARKTGQSKHLG